MTAQPGKPSPPLSERDIPRLNWDRARARLESAATAASEESAAAADIDEVLRRRAKALARPNVQRDGVEAGGGDLIATVAFSLNTQAFAIPAEFVREAVTVSQITPLPGMPSTLRGLVNLRSRIVSAFDLRTLLRLSARADSPSRELMLMLEYEGAEFGILVDEVIGARSVDSSQLRHGIPGFQAQYTRGLAEDGLILIDLPDVFAALTEADRTS